MSETLKSFEQYRGRSPGVVPVNFTIDQEAAELLRHVAPGMRRRGRFISRLIFEYAARQEERQSIRDQLAEVLNRQQVEGASDV